MSFSDFATRTPAIWDYLFLAITLFATFSALPLEQVRQKYLSYAEDMSVKFPLKRARDRSNKGVLEELTSVLIKIAGHSGCAVWGVGLGRLVAGIVGSNPAQGMDVCSRLSVLCCPV
jgi:hypothetical protein